MESLTAKLDAILGALKSESPNEPKPTLTPVHASPQSTLDRSSQPSRPKPSCDQPNSGKIPYGSANAPRPKIEPPNARKVNGRVPADVLIQHLSKSLGKKTRETFEDRPEMIPGFATITWDEVRTIVFTSQCRSNTSLPSIMPLRHGRNAGPSGVSTFAVKIAKPHHLMNFHPSHKQLPTTPQHLLRTLLVELSFSHAIRNFIPSCSWHFHPLLLDIVSHRVFNLIPSLFT